MNDSDHFKVVDFDRLSLKEKDALINYVELIHGRPVTFNQWVVLANYYWVIISNVRVIISPTPSATNYPVLPFEELKRIAHLGMMT